MYRLVTHDPPNSGDFQPRYGKRYALEEGVPELMRVGISHYQTREDVDTINTRGSRVARLVLDERFYLARTGEISGHLDVWARVEEFVEVAEVVP